MARTSFRSTNSNSSESFKAFQRNRSGKSNNEFKDGKEAAKKLKQRRQAQELKNDTYSEETESPSQISPDDPANALEFLDSSEDKKNRIPGPHGDSVNKSAQKEIGLGVNDEAMTQNDEYGNLSDADPVVGPKGQGGRTPGRYDQDTSKTPSQHERTENSKGTQIAS